MLSYSTEKLGGEEEKKKTLTWDLKQSGIISCVYTCHSGKQPNT